MKLRGSVGYGGENHAEDVAKVQLALSHLRRPSPKKFVPYWIWDIDGDFFDGAIGLALRFVEYDRKIRDTGLLTPASPVFRVISGAYSEATEDHRRIVETAFQDGAKEPIGTNLPDVMNKRVSKIARTHAYGNTIELILNLRATLEGAAHEETVIEFIRRAEKYWTLERAVSYKGKNLLVETED